MKFYDHILRYYFDFKKELLVYVTNSMDEKEIHIKNNLVGKV